MLPSPQPEAESLVLAEAVGSEDRAVPIVRATFAHPLSHYVGVFGSDVRTMKRWIAKGRGSTPADLPPLDAPSEMAAWWSRNMTWGVPERLLALASPTAPTPPVADAPAASTASASGPASPTTTSEAAKSSGGARKLDLPEGSGFSAALDRARNAERTAYAAWQGELAKDPFDAGQEEMRHRSWQRAVETVRKMEKDAAEIMDSDNEFVRVSEYDAVVAEKLQVLNQTIRSAIVRVATKLSLPADIFSRVNQAFQAEIDNSFQQLADSDYSGSTFQLQPHAQRVTGRAELLVGNHHLPAARHATQEPWPAQQFARLPQYCEDDERIQHRLGIDPHATQWG